MTYWGSFGQQQPRRHIGGVTSSAAGQQNDDNLRQSAFGQQQQRQPASGGNWQSAMASGQRNTGSAAASMAQQYGQQRQAGYGQQQRAMPPGTQQHRGLPGGGSAQQQQWERDQLLAGRQQGGGFGGQQGQGAGQQGIRPYGILGQGQSNPSAMRTQFQQQSGGYPQPYGIRNAPSQRAYGEQRGYMPDPGTGYRPGQGGQQYALNRGSSQRPPWEPEPQGGYGGGQQGGPRYDPRDYIRDDPLTGEKMWIDPADRDRYGRLTGYNVDGTPTYDRQRFEAEQLGRINGADTLQGRAQGLIETTQLGQLDIAQANQRLDQLVRTGQLSISQRNQALQELQNSQQYGLQGQRLGLDTELGRGDLDLRRQQNAQDWQYKMAQTAANPASAATMAALSGNAPWLRPQQPQIAARPGSPLSSAQTGVLSGREMNYNTYGRLNPSEQAAYGSYARAAYGVEQPDLEQQMRQYAPGQGGGMQTARWR